MKKIPEFAGHAARVTQGVVAGEPHAEAIGQLSPSSSVPRRQIGADHETGVTQFASVRSDPIAGQAVPVTHSSSAGDPIRRGQRTGATRAPIVPADPIGADHTSAVTQARCDRSDLLRGDHKVDDTLPRRVPAQPILDGLPEHDNHEVIAVEAPIASGGLSSSDTLVGRAAAGESHPPPEAICHASPGDRLSPAEDRIASVQLDCATQRAAAAGEPPPPPEAATSESPIGPLPTAEEPIDPAEAERVEAVVAKIRTLHRRASFCTAQRVALGNRLAAFVRVEFLGFSTFDDAVARAKAIAASHKLIKAARAGDELDLPDEEAAALHGLVINSDLAMAPFEEIEDSCLKRMKNLCRELPGHSFVSATRGFGEISFARIIGETNSLHWYANPAKVWKRLGLAVINGERQRRHTNVELALLHGFNAKRRSVSWVAFESLLKAQGSGDTAGPYRQLYDAAKERYLAREGWTKMHAHRAAARYAEKRLLLQLWRAWRQEIRGHRRDDTHYRHAPDPLAGGHYDAVTQPAGASGDPLESGQGQSATHAGPAALEPVPLGHKVTVTQSGRAKGKPLLSGRARDVTQGKSAGQKLIVGGQQAADTRVAHASGDPISIGQPSPDTQATRADGDHIESGQRPSDTQVLAAALDPILTGHAVNVTQRSGVGEDPIPAGQGVLVTRDRSAGRDTAEIHASWRDARLSECAGKVTHSNKRLAATAIRTNGWVDSAPYECRFCGGWHIGPKKHRHAGRSRAA